MIKKAEGKKAIQRRRKMRHFIDATDQIISECGVEALTIRGISDIAGYNSATLYNYFSNMDHLIYYSYMKHIPEFDQILRSVFNWRGSSSDQLELIWRTLCKLAYENTEIVNAIMFSHYSQDFNKILNDYFRIYPEKFNNSDEEILDILFENSIFDVVLNKLSAFETEHDFEVEEIEELNSFIMTYFQGHLVRRMTIDSEIPLESYLKRMVRFMDQIIWSYTIKRN
jgi:AcrR family transcriptional regulator